jgi:hypothetical protein
MNRRNKMRLIDADAFEKFIRKNCADSLVDLWCELVRRQPTAYDIEDIVNQLGDYGNEEMDYYRNTPYEKCIEKCVHKAIGIVKAGGINE